MSALTAKDLRAAARHARELASEICEDRMPPLTPYSYCGCAAGEIVKRMMGITEIKEDSAEWKLALTIDSYLPDDPQERIGEEGMVSAALRQQVWHAEEYPYATAVPLFCLADELENAARQRRPQRNPHE